MALPNFLLLAALCLPLFVLNCPLVNAQIVLTTKPSDFYLDLNLNLAPFLQDLLVDYPFSSLHFIEYGPILDFSLILSHWPSIVTRRFGMDPKEGVEWSQVSKDHQTNRRNIEHLSRRHVMQNYINIFLFPEKLLRDSKHDKKDKTAQAEQKLMSMLRLDINFRLDEDLYQMKSGSLSIKSHIWGEKVLREKHVLELLIQPQGFLFDNGTMRNILNGVSKTYFIQSAHVFVLECGIQNGNEFTSGLVYCPKWDKRRFGPSSYIRASANANASHTEEHRGQVKAESQFYRNKYEEDPPEFIPLSFATTDVHLSFLVWLFCGFLPFLALLVELMCSFHSRIIFTILNFVKRIGESGLSIESHVLFLAFYFVFVMLVFIYLILRF